MSEAAEWSSWRWSYDPMFWPIWGRYRPWDKFIKGYRFGPVVVWKYRRPYTAPKGEQNDD